MDEFDQLSDRLLSGFELQTKIASLSSSSTPLHSIDSSSALSSGNTSGVEEDDSPRITAIDSSTELIPFDNKNNNKTKKRKRKSYYVKRYPFPRILKRDIRRDYAIMLTNVLNSADENLMLKFFQRFGTQSCQYVDCFPDEYINNQPFIRYAKGIDAIVYRLLQDFSSIPDFVIRLKNANIVQKNEIKGSQIVCNVEFSGTKMFHYMRPDLITSIEEMCLGNEESKEEDDLLQQRGGEEGEGDTSPVTPSSSSKDKNMTVTTANYLKKVMKRLANDDSSFSSPSTLSDTENNLRTNRMKILSLYSHEYQQLLQSHSSTSSSPFPLPSTDALKNMKPEDLAEMKLSSEPVDQLLTQFLSNPEQAYSANIQDLMNLYSSYVKPSSSASVAPSVTVKNLANEEKIDSNDLINYMNKFLSGSPSLIPPTPTAAIGHNSSSNNDLQQLGLPGFINTELLKKNDKPLLSKPLQIKFAGQITLSLNEEHCLYQLEVKSSIYDTKIVLNNPFFVPSSSPTSSPSPTISK